MVRAELATTAIDEAFVQERSSDRRERPSGAHGQPDRVDGDRHAVVLPDRAHGVAGELAQVEQAGEVVVAREGDLGGLERHVGAPDAHRDADVGQRQGRGVVGAVAHHRDGVALLLQAPDDVLLVLRHHLGAPLVDAELGGHRRRDLRMVAGEHHDAPHPVGPQGLDDVAGLGTHGVAQADQTGETPVDGEQEGGLGRRPQAVDPRQPHRR